MPLSPEEVYDEVVRLVTEAETEEQSMAVGFLLGRIDTLSREILAMSTSAATAPAAEAEAN